MPINQEKEYGITLLELLITIALSCFILFFAQPIYSNFQTTIREEIAVSALSEVVILAKNLASIEERSLTLCGSIDGKSCIDAEQYDWPGWILFYDEASFIPSPDTLIHYFSSENLHPFNLTIKTSRNIGGGLNVGPRRQYAYGMARSIPNGRIDLCRSDHQATDQYTSIVINVYGYARIEKKRGAC